MARENGANRNKMKQTKPKQADVRGRERANKPEGRERESESGSR